MQGQGVINARAVPQLNIKRSKEFFLTVTKKNQVIKCRKCGNDFKTSLKYLRIVHKQGGGLQVCGKCHAVGKSELHDAMQNLAMRKQQMKSTKRK